MSFLDITYTSWKFCTFLVREHFQCPFPAQREPQPPCNTFVFVSLLKSLAAISLQTHERVQVLESSLFQLPQPEQLKWVMIFILLAISSCSGLAAMQVYSFSGGPLGQAHSASLPRIWWGYSDLQTCQCILKVYFYSNLSLEFARIIEGYTSKP